ncbi:hypothetical protein CBL_11006 [Carabus blaptoides fortunei]
MPSSANRTRQKVTKQKQQHVNLLSQCAGGIRRTVGTDTHTVAPAFRVGPELQVQQEKKKFEFKQMPKCDACSTCLQNKGLHYTGLALISEGSLSPRIRTAGGPKRWYVLKDDTYS